MLRNTSKRDLLSKMVNFIANFGHKSRAVYIAYGENRDLEKLVQQEQSSDEDETQVDRDNELEDMITNKSFDEIVGFHQELGKYIKKMNKLLGNKEKPIRLTWDLTGITTPITPTSSKTNTDTKGE